MNEGFLQIDEAGTSKDGFPKQLDLTYTSKRGPTTVKLHQDQLPAEENVFILEKNKAFRQNFMVNCTKQWVNKKNSLFCTLKEQNLLSLYGADWKCSCYPNKR